MTRMTVIPDGKKYAGRSLAWAAVHDPSWFFFCVAAGHLRRWWVARSSEIVAKARSILVGELGNGTTTSSTVPVAVHTID